jgi:hypothetical protein
MHTWFHEKPSHPYYLDSVATGADATRLQITRMEPELWMVHGAWINNASGANAKRSDRDPFRQYTIGYEPTGWNLAGEVIPCTGSGEKELTMARISSYGDTWNADVTAFGMDGIFYQTEPAYAYVDIMSKMTYIPDDVFDAIVTHIKANDPSATTWPAWDAEYDTYFWKG